MFAFTNGFGEISENVEVISDTHRYMELEENFKIKVAPLNFSGTTTYDFVYINSGKIIVIVFPKLYEINLLTKEKKTINPPEFWEEIYYQQFKEPIYDQFNNTIHTNFTVSGRGVNRSSYYILHLDNYTWELIDDVGHNFDKHWYDSKNLIIYTVQYKINNFDNNSFDRDSDGFAIRIVIIYDLSKRKIIDTIELPQTSNDIQCIYGNPVKILSSINDKDLSSIYHYSIYSTTTKESIFFIDNEESIIDTKINFDLLSHYIPINENGCFIMVNRKRDYKSGIVIMDIHSNRFETIALDDFPYTIYNFKKIGKEKYAFMAQTRNSFGGPGPSFLCYWEYLIH